MKSGMDREVGQLRASSIVFSVRQLGRPAASGMHQVVFTYCCLAEAEVGFRAAYGWFYFLTPEEVAAAEASSGQLMERTWRHYQVRWFIPTQRDHRDATAWSQHLAAVRASYSLR